MHSKVNELERRRVLGEAQATPRRALFLDRDGVVIVDKHHLCEPDGVELCTGAEVLLKTAKEAGWPVVLITNQSGIARGLFKWDDYERVTDQILELVANPALIAGIYANGHGPEAPTSTWRKPSPAMLMVAAEDLNLNLNGSVLVGDRLSDLMAGERAGLARLCHVMTGHGKAERSSVEAWTKNRHLLEESGRSETLFFEDLLGVSDAFKGWQS